MKKQEKKAVWKPFIHLLRITKLPYMLIILYTILSLAEMQLAMLFPSYSQKITSGDVRTKTILTMIFVIIGQELLSGVVSFVNLWTTAKISLRFRETIWSKILCLPVPYYDENQPRELISRVTDDTTQCSELLSALLPSVISSIYELVGTFIILFTYNWRLAAMEAIILPIAVLCVMIEARIEFHKGIALQQKLADLTGYLAEILTHIPLVKMFVREKEEEKRGDECIDALFHTKFRFSVIQTGASTLTSLVNVGNTIVAVVFGIWLVSSHIITLDVWIAYYLYSQMLLQSLLAVMSLWSGIKGSQGAVLRIAGISMEIPEDYEKGNTELPETAEFELKDLSFAYDEREILSHLSLVIPSGKITAIVGPSGSGKSTLLYLLERFYQPKDGEVCVNSENIENFSLASWREEVGYVSQDTLLFSGTIKENILYGVKRTVSEEEFLAAAEAACITEFTDKMEAGFDTQVGEMGAHLSGGQRQRIGIARTLLQNPKILLLDEVTANLDVESEVQVTKALANLCKGKTTVMIAHRLDSVCHADKIVVLEQGKIHGEGTHEELLETDSLYRQMVENQKKQNLRTAGMEAK